MVLTKSIQFCKAGIEARIWKDLHYETIHWCAFLLFLLVRRTIQVYLTSIAEYKLAVYDNFYSDLVIMN